MTVDPITLLYPLPYFFNCCTHIFLNASLKKSQLTNITPKYKTKPMSDTTGIVMAGEREREREKEITQS